MLKDSRVRPQSASKPKPKAVSENVARGSLKPKETNYTSFPQITGTKLSPRPAAEPRTKQNPPRKTSPRQNQLSKKADKASPRASKGSKPTSENAVSQEAETPNGNKCTIDPCFIDEDLQARVNTSRKFNKSLDTDFSFDENRSWLESNPGFGSEMMPQRSASHSQLDSKPEFGRDKTIPPQQHQSSKQIEPKPDFTTEANLPQRSTSPTQLAQSSLCSKGAITQTLHSLESIGSVHEMVKKVRQSIDSQPDQDITSNLDYKNLYSILGKEKMDRLLNNLHEGEWYSSEESGAENKSPVNIWTSLESSTTTNDYGTQKQHTSHSTNGERNVVEHSKYSSTSSDYRVPNQHSRHHTIDEEDMTDPRYQYYNPNRDSSDQVFSQQYPRNHHNTRESVQSVPGLPIEDDVTDVTDGFKTHRPEYEEPAEEIFVYDSSRLQDKSVVESDTSTNRNYVQTVHCAFSAEQIYAEAEHYEDKDPPVRKSSYVPFHAYEAMPTPNPTQTVKQKKVNAENITEHKQADYIHQPMDRAKPAQDKEVLISNPTASNSGPTSKPVFITEPKPARGNIDQSINAAKHTQDHKEEVLDDHSEPWTASESQLIPKAGTNTKPEPMSDLELVKNELRSDVKGPTQIDIADWHVEKENDAEVKQFRRVVVDPERKEVHKAGVRSHVEQRYGDRL